MTIFEENEGETDVHRDSKLDVGSFRLIRCRIPVEAATQITNRPTGTQHSTQPASRMLARADTEIPSTHPDEDVSLSVSQESTEPAPPAGRFVSASRTDLSTSMLTMCTSRSR